MQPDETKTDLNVVPKITYIISSLTHTQTDTDIKRK